jgi:mono/diheme cytochrome c family protein
VKILRLLPLAAALALPAAAQDAAQVKRGYELYKQKNCQMCHQLGGQGNRTGTAHDGVGSRLKPEEIRQWLVDPKAMAQKKGSTKKPPMIPYKHLPKADLDALVAYLSSLK